MKSLLGVLTLTLLSSNSGDEQGRILRPQDGSALTSEEISIVATGPEGRLELDGQRISAQEPFPNVLYAKLRPTPGEHVLGLTWKGGRCEIRFFVGEDAPPTFRLFKQHPPVATDCTHCHGLSRRGRFRFKGGVFRLS